MQEQIYAHSRNSLNEYHLLSAHLHRVAELTSEFAGEFDAKELGYWLGLWHDLGKAEPNFQKKLIAGDERIRVDHKFAGAYIAYQHFNLLSFLIACHHGGLKDLQGDFKAWFEDKSKQANPEALIETAGEILESFEPPKPPESDSIQRNIPPFLLESKSRFEAEFFLRMLFSCLVDADFLDTEAHFYPEKSAVRRNEISLEEMENQFLEFHQTLDKSDTPINRIRNQVYDLCIKAAEAEIGFFRLQVPTGGGKTLSSLAFALKHCLKHNQRRIIYALPYTSIIEQTAGIFKSIFGEENVLEHHSGFIVEGAEEEYDIKQIRWRLASENWDFPLIVTTTVQLFESIFSDRISRLRKLHNLSRSVIILDEVQTLPVHLLEPILDVLQELVRHYHASVVFCTATQPEFEENYYLKGISEPVEEIVPQPERLYAKLKRVNYELPALEKQWSWREVADVLTESKQAMAVVNTKSDALKLLRELEEVDGVFHLSTLLCGAHRRDVLDIIRERLKAGETCRLVSTQVVEAGVDIDFPLVLRAMGPLDRIVQAGGRCNREGRLPQPGRVIIFQPEDGGMPPGEYRTETDNARAILKAGKNLHYPDTYQEYFYRVYQSACGDEFRIQEKREGFHFPAVAEAFHLIRDNTVPVVVKYEGMSGNNQTIHEIIDKAKYISPLKTMRRLQPFIIGLCQKQFHRIMSENKVEELISGIYLWKGGYDLLRGIQFDYLNPEDLTF